MKSDVRYITIRCNEGVRAIQITDENGNLKYHFFLKLLDDGVVVKDDFAWKVLEEMARAYAGLPKAQHKQQTSGLAPTPHDSWSDTLADLKLEQDELH